MSNQISVDFKVAAVSSNKNSFGLAQCVLISQDGLAYKACANSLNIPSEGDTVSISYIGGTNKLSNAKLNFAEKGFEIPERVLDAPKEIINELWK